MALAWMPDEDLLNRVLDGISDEEFSDESEAKLSVHGESESEEEGTAEILATLAIQMFTATTTVCFSFVYSH